MTGPLDEAPQDELQDLDRRISETSELIRQLRESITGDSAGMDAPERAAVLTNIEEQEGILDGLRRRREALEQQLGS